jgi:hypothetical protein
VTQQPQHGQVYRASDDKWYRWPDTTPYDTEEAARGATPPPPMPPAAAGPGAPRARRVKQKRLGFLPGWRIFTYVILAFNLLMLVWLIGGVGGAVEETCRNETGSALEACEAGATVGAGIGAIVIFVLWALGDVILGVLWLVTRSSKRDCPVCGNKVKKGMVQCPSCGFDYRRQWQGAPA